MINTTPSDFRLQTSYFKPQTSDLILQTSDFRPQTSDFIIRFLAWVVINDTSPP